MAITIPGAEVDFELPTICQVTVVGEVPGGKGIHAPGFQLLVEDDSRRRVQVIDLGCRPEVGDSVKVQVNAPRAARTDPGDTPGVQPLYLLVDAQVGQRHSVIVRPGPCGSEQNRQRKQETREESLHGSSYKETTLDNPLRHTFGTADKKRAGRGILAATSKGAAD
jgi:hypothetical protein